jgi:hypothetical protein
MCWILDSPLPAGVLTFELYIERSLRGGRSTLKHPCECSRDLLGKKDVFREPEPLRSATLSAHLLRKQATLETSSVCVSVR